MIPTITEIYIKTLTKKKKKWYFTECCTIDPNQYSIYFVYQTNFMAFSVFAFSETC